MSNRRDGIPLVIQGNIVVPVSNPFLVRSDKNTVVSPTNEAGVEWLGDGLKVLKNHILTVNRNGIIQEIRPAKKDKESVEDSNDATFLRLAKTTEFLLPGMIDLHIHAPQYAYTGTATDRPLMGPNGWLEQYAFPAEARLLDNPQLCRHVYNQVVQTTLHSGTTTAVYFATLHAEPTQTLVDTCLQHGQRALIGKVCMDRNNSSQYYQQTLEQNVTQTEQVIQYIYQKAGKRHFHVQDGSALPLPLILPLITPRFIPSCTPQLLTQLGQLARYHNCHITSHISESLDQVEVTKHLEDTTATVTAATATAATATAATATPSMARTDAQILDSHHLLTNACIMAHGVHLSHDDFNLLRKRGTAIAHCPLSNFFFAHGCLPCRHLMERGNRVGLGTDVAGGYSPSMLHSSRMAVIASRAYQQQQQQQQSTQDTHILDYRHALYLATLGGAEALGLENHIGTFREGMEFDAIILSARPQGSSSSSSSNASPVFVLENEDSMADVLQKLLVLGDDRNVTHVFVQGRHVKGCGNQE